MFTLFATLIGIPVSIFGITLFNEVKNRKSVRKKSLKKTISFFGLKSSIYLHSLLSVFFGSLSLLASNSTSVPLELQVISTLPFFLVLLSLAFQCLMGIKNISIGNLFTKKEISKFIHLSEKASSMAHHGLGALNESETIIHFRNQLKNGEKHMYMDEFVLYSLSPDKLEKYLEMKLELQELEELIEEKLLSQYLSDWKSVEIKNKEGIVLIDSINKMFEEMKEDVGKQTFSKKMIKKAEEEKQNEETISMLKENENMIQRNDLGLVLLDMKSVSGDIKYSSEDRKRADEYVLRIEKELEKRTQELEHNKLKEDIHVLFKTAEMILEKNEIH